MVSTNPYHPPTIKNSWNLPKQTKKSVLLLAIAINFLSLAGFLFLFSESWTFNTPYSTEGSWLVTVPGIFEFSISAALGFSVLTLLLLLGTLFLCLATVAFWRDRISVAVDETESNQS
jgi:putative flippase GtrA